MGSKDSDQSLPEVGEAPLIIDVEFLEEDDETLAQPLDSIEEVSFSTPRSAMELPPSLPTPQGRARVVTVINQKGGVGKTTTVINIAAQIALRGFRVLVIDSDSQGNCATGLGVDKSKVKNTTRDLILSPETAIDSRHATAVENLHIIVGDRSLIGLEQEMMRQLGREKRMKEALQPLLAHYDLVLIDTPPSLGLVTINALVASDGVLVPVQTEYFALEGLALLSGTIREVRSLLNERLGVDGVLLTMHSQTLLNKQVAGEVLENFPDLVVKPAIRRNVRLAEAPSHGIPIHLHDPSSPGGKDYQDIATELQHRWSL
ncbi:MAG: sporulation initiation inhibitor protein Soj [Methanobacteriota archaeon]|jgi:chromosome partitioning protein|nr:AAA family ATPase [Candidatus Thalassarchaeum sp.]GIS48244.1 MAG: sporulation initiation inhibitor protein Soj [Euryarchaeota archaeon]|tara:strand:- start:1516 stop:2466 length:951 start_codon:yes stop_codon:yes gene_type:complete